MSAQADDDWERFVMRKFPELVKILRPSLLMDHLRARKMIVGEEYNNLRSMKTEEERSRALLHDYLPHRPGAFQEFCEVLAEVDGQEHVRRKILPGRAAAGDSGRPRPTRKRRSENLRQSDIRTRGMAAKAIRHNGKNKRATFIFDSKYKEEVEQRDVALKEICELIFEIAPENVTVLFRSRSSISEISEVEHPCQCGEIKLICLVLYGVPPDLVGVKREHLIDCITAYLKDENVSVTRKNIKFSEALESSAFVVLPMEFEAYFTLFCALAKPGKAYQLGFMLQNIFTGMTKAVLRIGGLPPVILLDEKPEDVAPTDTVQWEVMSDEEVKEEESVTFSSSTVESKFPIKDHHGLPPIACDIPISQLPNEVRRRIVRSSGDIDTRKEDWKQYLLSHFPQYFESESDAIGTIISGSPVKFMDNLIYFLSVTVSTTLDGLYRVLHDMRCQDACHAIQRYLLSHWKFETQKADVIMDCVEKPSYPITQRPDSVERICRAFESLQAQLGESGCQYVVVTGPTVSGKTELARDYFNGLVTGWERGKQTDPKSSKVAAMLKAGSLEDLELSLRLLVVQLGGQLVVKTLASINNRLRRIEKLLENVGYALKRSAEWIIILDGLESSTWAATERHWPHPGSTSWGVGKITITTSEGCIIFPGEKAEETRKIDVKPQLNDTEAVDLFMSISGQGNRSFAEKVTSMLDNHVLAVASAALYASRYTEFLPNQFLSHLGEKMLKIPEENLPRSLQASLKLMLSSMAESSDSLRSLLQLLSITGPFILPLVVIEAFLGRWLQQGFLKSFLRIVQGRTVTGDIETCRLFLRSQIPGDVEKSEGSISTASLHYGTRHVLTEMGLNDGIDSEKLWLTVVESLVQCCDIKDLLSGKGKHNQLRQLLLPHMLHLLSSTSITTGAATEAVGDAWLLCAAAIESLGAEYRVGIWTNVGNKFEQQRDCIENALKVYSNVDRISPVKVIECHLLLTEVYEELCQPHLAKQHAQKAVKAARTFTSRLPRAIKLLGRICLDNGESEEAIQCFHESRKLFRNTYGRNSIHEASVMTLMARAYHDAGQNDVSQRLLQEAFTICAVASSKTAGDDFSLWVQSQTLASLGRSYLEPDFTEATKAIDYIEKCLDIRLRLYGFEHSMTALTMTSLGRAYLVNQQHLIAKAKLQRALEIQNILLPLGHRDRAMTMQVLGNVERRCENWSEAIRLLEESLSIREGVGGQSHQDTAFVKTDLAVALLAVSRNEEALRLLLDALEAKRKRFGEDHIEMAIGYACLRDAYLAVGDDTKAKQCNDRHKNIMQRLPSRTGSGTV